MIDGIRRQVTLTAPIEVVWSAVATSAGLDAWLGCTHAEVDARPGARIVVRWPDGATSRGLIEEIEAPRRIVFRWRRIAGAGLDLRVGQASRVTIELEPADDGGTTVTVTETDIPGLVAEADAGRARA